MAKPDAKTLRDNLARLKAKQPAGEGEPQAPRPGGGGLGHKGGEAASAPRPMAPLLESGGSAVPRTPDVMVGGPKPVPQYEPAEGVDQPASAGVKPEPAFTMPPPGGNPPRAPVPPPATPEEKSVFDFLSKLYR